MTVTKADLVDSLYNKISGMNKNQAAKFVDDLFDLLREELANGKSIKLAKFGVFNLLDKKERPGRNPKTGEEVAIAARKVVTFKASKILKDKVERQNKLEQD